MKPIFELFCFPLLLCAENMSSRNGMRQERPKLKKKVVDGGMETWTVKIQRSLDDKNGVIGVTVIVISSLASLTSSAPLYLSYGRKEPTRAMEIVCDNCPRRFKSEKAFNGIPGLPVIATV